ncbi:serine/threonine-protein kinase [Spirillospora sp. CA-255316]
MTGRLGEGGQGVVFLGERAAGAESAEGGDTGGPAGPVAIKLLRAWLGHDPGARARFMRELDTAKRVARFCTAAVLDADVDGDHPYIVSEYVDGPSLHQVVRGEGPRDGGVLERLAVGTATALVAIHQAGVVHRDFKPHNVLLGPDGPRVIDFGIARALDGSTITATGAGMGTPAYMAPEQLSGERAGPPADVFAWAATMVFASCGRPPFGNDALTAVAHRVLHGEPDLGALSGPLRELAARCMEKDPALRPAASQVLRTLLGERERDATDPLPPAVLRAAAAGPTVPAGQMGAGVPAGTPAPSGPPAPSGASASVPSSPSGTTASSGASLASGAATSPGTTAPPEAAASSGAPASSVRADGSAPPAGPAPATVPGTGTGGGERRGVSGVVAVSAAVVAVSLAVVVTVLALSGGLRFTGGEGGTGGPSDGGSTPPRANPGVTTTTTATTPAGFPAAFAGTWTGQVRQNDGKVFTVSLTLPEGKRQGQVSYPEHRCSGVVTPVGEPGGQSLTLREQITSNTAVCVDTGTITLTRQSGATLNFSYTGTDQGRTWMVVGTLARS